MLLLIYDALSSYLKSCLNQVDWIVLHCNLQLAGVHSRGGTTLVSMLSNVNVSKPNVRCEQPNGLLCACLCFGKTHAALRSSLGRWQLGSSPHQYSRSVSRTGSALGENCCALIRHRGGNRRINLALCNIAPMTN